LIRTALAYETAIRSVTYLNTSENPSGLTRTVSFVINDGENNSNAVARDIEFTPVNDVPVLSSIESLPAIFVENGAPLGVTDNLILTDVDHTNIESATISISGNYAAGQDELLFTNQSGITGNYNPGTGVLTLNGAASVADYQLQPLLSLLIFPMATIGLLLTISLVSAATLILPPAS